MCDPIIGAVLPKTPEEANIPSREVAARPASTFSVPLLGALFVFSVLIGGFALPVLRVFVVGRGGTSVLDVLISDLTQLLVVGFALSLRPRILFLSRLRPRLEDAGWLLAGFVANSLPLVTAPAELRHNVGIWVYAVSLMVTTPVLEEMVDRGIFLRSLLDRLPRPVAILCIAAVSAFQHQRFWVSFPIQVLLGSVYAYRKNSLSASVACHIGCNTAALVFFSKIV